MTTRAAVLGCPAFSVHFACFDDAARAPSVRAEAPRYFHVHTDARAQYAIDDALFAIRGDIVFADFARAHELAARINAHRGLGEAERVRASELNAMGLVHEVAHALVGIYRRTILSDVFYRLRAALTGSLGPRFDATLRAFVEQFPPPSVHRRDVTPGEYLAAETDGVPNEQWVLEELLLLWLCNQNPAFAPIHELVSDAGLATNTAYREVIDGAKSFFDGQPHAGPGGEGLLDMLLAPIRHAPDSIEEQIEFMRAHWGLALSGLESWRRLLGARDFIAEEGRWFLRKSHGFAKEDAATPPVFRGELYEHEPEKFSPDTDWMPNVVMIAKSTYVWLDQLSKQYARPITTFRDIPDEELDELAQRGFTVLWLIGVWERSRASAKIKRLNGNSEAVASAYSLKGYAISNDLGGDDAYGNLRDRAAQRGLRLAADMVPNHMGLDSDWLLEHPRWFVQNNHPPFPNYSFNGADLSHDSRVGIFIEDGYWSKSDAAVVFKRVDRATDGAVYVYHGNDGTSMPWNDTAQLNYLLPEVREAVVQTILHVARLFPVIRFDAAMTLAKRHYQRLWFPVPGSGGDIPSRSEHGLTRDRFDELFPREFWREVVDRVAQEAPNTLLLAEAFWMMEGYFVRTLGMHRVYNSAFMNMLKKEDNAGYRTVIKNTLEYNPQILRRFVNFMNNPDEETAVAQFGKDGKYFGTAVLMATMPGLPMFGHGQLEGFEERYGMEYRRAYRDENPDQGLVARHEREVFPLLRKRYLFSDVAEFLLYDFEATTGGVDEDVFAYSNRVRGERALILYQNKYKETRGYLKTSVAYRDGDGSLRRRTLAEGLGLGTGSGRYLVFRDQVSGLEYLRLCSELAEKGLYAELGAFGYHVFVEFREVVDSPKKPYARLEQTLAGRGSASIENALLELVGKPIFDSYFEAIHAGSARYLCAGWDHGKQAIFPEVMTVLGDKRGELEAGVRELDDAFHTDESGEAVLAARFEALMTLLHGAPPERDEAPWRVRVREALRGQTGAVGTTHALIALIYTDSIAREPGEDVVTRRGLFGVLKRAFRDAGASREQAERAAGLVHALTLLDTTRPLRELLASVLGHKGVRAFLEVHADSGEVWFRREPMLDLLDVLVVLRAIAVRDEPDDATGALFDGAMERERASADAFAEVGEACGYRFHAWCAGIASMP